MALGVGRNEMQVVPQENHMVDDDHSANITFRNI